MLFVIAIVVIVHFLVIGPFLQPLPHLGIGPRWMAHDLPVMHLVTIWLFIDCILESQFLFGGSILEIELFRVIVLFQLVDENDKC